MRPGQLTPENESGYEEYCDAVGGFNEAGAINPGKRTCWSSPWPARGCFNEAGAINPGKHCDLAENTSARMRLQ